MKSLSFSFIKLQQSITMPPKKATTTGAATKKTATSSHASYKDMIRDAILNLKERNGSSRQSLKKYVQANNQITVASPAAFDAHFNKAIKDGVAKGDFTQPKGPSGPVKLAKKDVAKPAKPAAKKAAPKKTTTTTTTKTGATKKPAAPKKAAAKPKANTAKPRKASTAAPAVVDQPKVVSKTKSGRVTKTTAKPAAKKATPKKKAPAKAPAAKAEA